MDERYYNYFLLNINLESVAVFVRFLLKYNAYLRFIKNFNRYTQIRESCDMASDFIADAFQWVDTAEGYRYWERLHMQWENVLREKSLL